MGFGDILAARPLMSYFDGGVDANDNFGAIAGERLFSLQRIETSSPQAARESASCDVADIPGKTVKRTFADDLWQVVVFYRQVEKFLKGLRRIVSFVHWINEY